MRTAAVVASDLHACKLSFGAQTGPTYYIVRLFGLFNPPPNVQLPDINFFADEFKIRITYWPESGSFHSPRRGWPFSAMGIINFRASEG